MRNTIFLRKKAAIKQAKEQISVDYKRLPESDDRLEALSMKIIKA